MGFVTMNSGLVGFYRLQNCLTAGGGQDALGPAVAVFQTDDIVLVQAGAELDLDDLQGGLSGIFRRGAFHRRG